MSSQRLVIAIDGPAGSGKTTVARTLATILGVPYVDTGAMYRAFTLKLLRTGSIEEVDSWVPLLDETKIESIGGLTMLDSDDVTREIRDHSVDSEVSRVAANPAVRAWMVSRQRAEVGPQGVVMEGRDIGTVVLPDAFLKVYLTADPSVRAQRRATQNDSEAVDSTLESIEERDRRDSIRSASPLKQAEDAILVDTTGKDVDEVVAHIMSLIAASR
ncbi:MAG TPA: (d)CMP kinase [Actinomycetota bacterium]|nr:(d)CMP kinase [Actinomycetota bacterium]